MTQIRTESPAFARGLMALLLLIVTTVFAFTAMPAGAAPSLTLKSRDVSAEMPVFRSEFPKPDDPAQIFYIQRSPNSNTVVYATRVENGRIDPEQPVLAYWRRYNTTGEARALKAMERRLAYGASASRQSDDSYKVTFKALESLTATLRLENGRPALFRDMGGTEARLVYAYLEVDEGGLFPKVTELSLVGRTPSGQYVTETYDVKGGVL